eukprot:Rmarinus@m.21193
MLKKRWKPSVKHARKKKRWKKPEKRLKRQLQKYRLKSRKPQPAKPKMPKPSIRRKSLAVVVVVAMTMISSVKNFTSVKVKAVDVRRKKGRLAVGFQSEIM